MNLRIAVAILTLFVAAEAGAGVVNYPKRLKFADYARNIGADTESIVQRYAATVVIRCNGKQATAQFTGSNDIMTTAGHLFFSREKCTQVGVESGCTITVETAGGQRRYSGFEMLDFGYRQKLDAIKRGRATCPRGGLPWEDDWAILRLTDRKAVKQMASEMKPFRIPMPRDVHMGREDVVAVGGAALDFFEYSESGTKIYPRSLQDCRIKNIFPKNGGGSYVETDCDTAKLMSGGPLLRPGRGYDTLIGIHMGSYETPEELAEAMRTGEPTTKAFKSGEWTGLYVSVDGELLKSLQAILNRNGEI